MITFNHKGNFNNTDKFLNIVKTFQYKNILEKYAQEGVNALKTSTPVDSGKTADSWFYDIKEDSKGFSITWSNSNINNGVPIAILIQYGHGTKNGGYIKGLDYINPALRPIFNKIRDDVWRVVTNS